MHFCANVVCEEEGTAGAVLVRSLEPVADLPSMRLARGPKVADAALCSGPARLCQALGIDRRLDGADLVQGDAGVALVSDAVAPPAEPLAGVRIGLSARVGEAADYHWRFAVPGSSYLSRPFPPAVSRDTAQERRRSR
jgi:DNA-3-methyladenine glycosylase